MRNRLPLSLVATLSMGVASILAIAQQQYYEPQPPRLIPREQAQQQIANARQPGAPMRTIANIRGNLYVGREAAYNSLFLVTPEGIVVADTITAGFSRWLKEELAKRFPGVPVKYVIYSHNHYDHVSGGKVFADTAQFIAHENMIKAMDGRIPGMPGGMIDRNASGRFEPEELIGVDNNRCGTSAYWYKTSDTDGDGTLTAKEVYAEVHPPTIVYSDRMKLTLGGETVELIHPGKNHSDDLTVVYFPAQRTVFAAEILPGSGRGKRMLPIACGPFNFNPLSEWIKSFKTIEALDFDILSGSHERLATKEDAIETRVLYEDLIAAVSTAISKGVSLRDMQKTILLEKYKDWDQYEERRALMIEAAYNNLMMYR